MPVPTLEQLQVAKKLCSYFEKIFGDQKQHGLGFSEQQGLLFLKETFPHIYEKCFPKDYDEFLNVGVLKESFYQENRIRYERFIGSIKELLFLISQM
jgi:hypothetical protein